ncbi:MAG: ubiquinol-cytochrome c reductase iron-sulfur subunit [Gammaproteobacteria bacterium]|nr:ubiquinol-cytochrome c reductase iron-sulfur subunit [Gammaproteobacteria bacterium]
MVCRKDNDAGACPGRAHRKITRRRVLTVATATLGTIGTGTAAIPFVRSMAPSARARARNVPIEVDVSKLDAGQQLTAAWRGKPIWVLHRPPQMLESLSRPQQRTQLRDPDSSVVTQQPIFAQNEYRSIRAEYFVAIGLCAHLGCVPIIRRVPESARDQFNGYFCPCHGSKFDFAGRVYKDVPAPTNLVVPPYRYLADTIVQIGVDASDDHV